MRLGGMVCALMVVGSAAGRAWRRVHAGTRVMAVEEAWNCTHSARRSYYASPWVSERSGPVLANIRGGCLPDVKIPADSMSKSLLEKYGSKIAHLTIPDMAHCDFFLCGTLHVSHQSSEMVREVIRVVRPQFVVLELCEHRLDGLMETEESPVQVTLKEVVKGAWSERSFKAFSMGLLAWMQSRAASLSESRLGGELSVACREAHAIGSTVVLGDRSYVVTTQRIFDRLKWHERARMTAMLLWETLTMKWRIGDYIQQSHNNEAFIDEEIDKFSELMPAFADVVVHERDEYLAQTLFEVARVGFGRPPNVRCGSVVVVLGAGHLKGVQRRIQLGEPSPERMREISSSQKHESTWPGPGLLHVVDPAALLAPDAQSSA